MKNGVSFRSTEPKKKEATPNVDATENVRRSRLTYVDSQNPISCLPSTDDGLACVCLNVFISEKAPPEIYVIYFLFHIR